MDEPLFRASTVTRLHTDDETTDLNAVLGINDVVRTVDARVGGGYVTLFATNVEGTDDLLVTIESKKEARKWAKEVRRRLATGEAYVRDK
jgi:hypothetical protein